MIPAKPLHIAHFIDTQNKGGAEVTMMDLCIHQKETGHDVTVIHHENPFIDELCIRHGIRQCAIPAYKLYKSTIKLPLYALFLAKRLKNLNIDILHSHLFGPITGNALPAKLCGCRHIGTLHDIYMIEEKPIRAKLLSFCHFLGTHLVCVSIDMAEFYKKRLSLENDGITTIYNASQKPKPLSDNDRQKIYNQYDINDSKLILTTVGRLVTLKRIDWIIDAIGAIDSVLQKNTTLLVIGDGPERDKLVALAEKKITSNVIFTGEVLNVNGFLQISDIYIQFSSTEGLSRSIIEAISCGLPCVVSDVGGNRELVIDDHNGYVIPAHDGQQLTRTLSALIKDDQSLRALGSASYTHFLKNFDFLRFQKSYIDIYSPNLTQKLS
jgi:glycosyltransferase involved in cell wall biosynthesis